MSPILTAFVSQLQKRNLNIEYRGEEDRIYVIGDTKNMDEPTRRGIQSSKKRLLKDILEPAYENSNGQPVRLPSVACHDDDD